MATEKMVCVTFRIPKDLHRKIAYIAKCDNKSKNQEYEWMIREWIRAFEDVYGEVFPKTAL